MITDDDKMTWREALGDARKDAGDETSIVRVAPDEATLDVRFYGGYGSSNGPSVLVWTETHVYFPVVYDGAEWLGSAPRDPVDDGQYHVGGQ